MNIGLGYISVMSICLVYARPFSSIPTPQKYKVRWRFNMGTHNLILNFLSSKRILLFKNL